MDRSSRLSCGFFVLWLTFGCSCPLLAWNEEGHKLESFDRAPIYVFGQEEVLHRVRQVVVQGSDLFILTLPEPAVHHFLLTDEPSYQAWGDRGQGPSELEGPVSLEVHEEKVLVVDQKLGNNKIVVYDLGGKYLETLSVPSLGLAGELHSTAGNLLIAGQNPGDPRTKIVDMSSGKLMFELPTGQSKEVTLRSKGAPSLTVGLPGAGRPRWLSLQDGRYAFWDGDADVIEVRELRDHRLLYRLKLPSQRIPFRSVDREHWIEMAIPVVDLPGQGTDPFKALREAAAKQVTFPESFARVLALRADAKEGIWVHRGRVAEGNVWSWLRLGKSPHTVVFGTNRIPMAFGEDWVVLKAEDELGVETLEVFLRSEVTGGGKPSDER